MARQIQGSAGPGVSTALQWHGYIPPSLYGLSSVRLCDAVAKFACMLANRIVERESISALMASGFIAQDKCPGVCPIGIRAGPSLNPGSGCFSSINVRNRMTEHTS